jgi:cell division protein ZapD
MYQQNLPQGRNVSLIRIGVPDRAGWVPEVSANRLLISVRIMRIEDGHRTQSMKADVDFLISNCG